MEGNCVQNKKIVIILIVNVFCSLVCSSCKLTSSAPSVNDGTQEALVSPTQNPITGIGEYVIDKEFEEVQKIVDELMPYYYETKVVFYNGLETSEEIKDEKAATYLIVQSDKYKSLDDIRKVAESVFTNNYLEKLYKWGFEGEQPKYREIDGKLCTAMSDAVGMGLQPDVIEIEKKSDMEIIVQMQSEEGEEIKDVSVTITNVDGNWRIDKIDDFK
jgi:hypothetical protein